MLALIHIGDFLPASACLHIEFAKVRQAFVASAFVHQ
jgi:hypothetical protein